MGEWEDSPIDEWSGYDEEDDGSGVADYRRNDRPVTVSHGRRALVQDPPFNAGRATSLRETEKAILCDRYDGKPSQWCPKGQIAAESQVKKPGDVGDLIVTAWIAREKGWLR